ncbi:MAG: PKD domain-containing protein [Vicinamibacterales bacterium]
MSGKGRAGVSPGGSTPAGGSGDITPSIAATRTSGTAPCAVLFDATGTTCSVTDCDDEFRQLLYSFDFGDSGSGTWAVSGLSKDTQTGGPIAAHVYDTDGSYTVTMTATLGHPWVDQTAPSEYTAGEDFVTNGGSTYKCAVTHTSTSSFATDLAGGKWTLVSASIISNSTQVGITVDNADTVYSGTNTICVSPTANYTGAPSGSQNQTTLPGTFNGKRVLLHKGESFSAISLAHTDNDIQIGSYGTGAKPIVASVSLGIGEPSAQDVFCDEITVMDLDITNGISNECSGSRFLLYRNSMVRDPGNNSIYIGSALQFFLDNGSAPDSWYYNTHEVFIVENDLLETITGTNNLINWHGSRFAILGNTAGTADQHTMRINGADRSVVAHNELRGISSDGIRLALKMGGTGFDAYDDDVGVTHTYATNKVVWANNLFGNAADNNSFTTSVAPQSTSIAEGLQDVVVENNTFIRGTNTNTECYLVGRRLTTRGNVRQDAGACNMSIGDQGVTPVEWFLPIYRND